MYLYVQLTITGPTIAGTCLERRSEAGESAFGVSTLIRWELCIHRVILELGPRLSNHVKGEIFLHPPRLVVAHLVP